MPSERRSKKLAKYRELALREVITEIERRRRAVTVLTNTKLSANYTQALVDLLGWLESEVANG